jgi:hypothetical protein
MMKLVLSLALVPSIALAHPGHHDGGVTHDATINNLALFALICITVCVAARIAKRVRS